MWIPADVSSHERRTRKQGAGVLTEGLSQARLQIVQESLTKTTHLIVSINGGWKLAGV
jgi:hypothetical protein